MRRSVTRLLLALALGASTLTPVLAQQFTVMGHRVHQLAATGTADTAKGGDITEEWRKAHGDINWMVGGHGEIYDRLMREAAMPTSAISVGILLGRAGYPEFFENLEPLSDYQAKDPISSFDDISKGMLDGMTYDGKLYAIPMRQATSSLIYNEALLKAAGVDAPPATFAEMVELAKKLSHKDASGTDVNGLTFMFSSDPLHPLNMIFGFGKQLIESDYTLNASTPEVLNALKALKDLYDSGGISKNILASTLDTMIADMQAGRAVMAIDVPGRLGVLNDPKMSAYAGSFKSVPLPLGPNGTSPTQTEVWYMVIPKNAPDKDLAWSLIKTLSEPEATIRMALNSNGAVRVSAYQDPRVIEAVATAAVQAETVPLAKLAIPGLRNGERVSEVITTQIGAMLLGKFTPEQTAENLQKELSALLPAKP